jgi:hypothetical protein
MVCILDKRKALVPVLSFKNSNAPILSVEFSFFFYITFNSATVAVGGQGFLSKGIKVLKKKAKEKLARPPFQKISLLSFFSPLSLFCILLYPSSQNTTFNSTIDDVVGQLFLTKA